MSDPDRRKDLARRYAQVRATTLALTDPLGEGDCQAQSMPDASPTKWHLAHTTWFFETFVLEAGEPGFRPHDPAFRRLFNSYYNGVGDAHPRPQRGLLTRPDLAAVRAYRRAIDERVAAVLAHRCEPQLLEHVELGIQHEQQHQELILTDLLHLLSCNPTHPAYRPADEDRAAPAATPLRWVSSAGGMVEIGFDGAGFAFDNEGPRHRQWLAPYALASRLVTQGEWLAFIDDGAYRDPRWWLSAGWDWVRSHQVCAPAYWLPGEAAASHRRRFSLRGVVDLQPDAPVSHVSLYEADAFARWYSAQHPHDPPCRLPSEVEWEHAASARVNGSEPQGNFLDAMALQALPASTPDDDVCQLLGDAWEWTASAYHPYPGYRPWTGTIGEYNGKFMVDQYVLRGGSCATPRSHIRATYRNFFPSHARWQFTGVRLARDAA